MPPKQPSRKGKKAWRKNVDIQEVTSGLEEVREQITQGGVIAEKANEDLFALDLGGDESIPARALKAIKPLRADEILSLRSAVPAVSSKKRENPNLGDGILPSKKKRRDFVSRHEIEKLKAIAHGQTAIPVATKKDNEFHDPWAAPPPKTKDELEKEKKNFLEEKKPVKPPKTWGLKPVSLTVAEREVPAVKIPDAGISYNPEFDKWDKLLQEEGAKEVEAEKKRLAQAEEERRIMELRAAPDEVPVEEESEEEESSSEDEEDAEEGSAKAKKIAERKTQAQRNKEKRKKEKARRAEEEKRQKQMERELALVQKYARDAKIQERMRMAKVLAKRARAEEKPDELRKKRFGKIELPQAPLEIQLPDELADSLRRLKPEGNALSDRFRSIRERGIIEHRAPIIQAKALRRKETEKWSYKDFDKPKGTGYR